MGDPAPGKIESDKAGWFVRDYFPNGVCPVSTILLDAAGSGTGIDFNSSALTTGILIDGVCVTGISITGAFTTAGISVSDITSMEGDAEAGVKIGSWGTPLNTIASMADNIRLFQGSAQCVDGPASGYKEVAIFSAEVQTDGSHDLTYVDFSPVHTKVTIDKALGWCYGIQSDVTKSGTGAIGDTYAVTAYLTTTGGPTFSTSGTFAPLCAMLSASGGNPSITGDVFGIWCAIRGQARADSALRIHTQSATQCTDGITFDHNSSTAMTNGINFGSTGTFTTGIDLADVCTTAIDIGTCTTGLVFSGTITQGSANHFISIGSYASPTALGAVTDHVFCSVTNVSASDDGASSKWIMGDYTKITITNANAQPNNSVAAYRPKLALNEGIGNAWGIQLDINCTGSWATNDLIGVGAYIDLGSGTITSTPGKVAAVQGDIYGAGTAGVTGECYSAVFRARGNITGVVDAIMHLGNQNGAITSIIDMVIDGTTTYAFDFGGAACDAWTSADAGAADIDSQDEYVLIPVKVDGVTPTLYMIAAETWN